MVKYLYHGEMPEVEPEADLADPNQPARRKGLRNPVAVQHDEDQRCNDDVHCRIPYHEDPVPGPVGREVYPKPLRQHQPRDQQQAEQGECLALSETTRHGIDRHSEHEGRKRSGQCAGDEFAPGIAGIAVVLDDRDAPGHRHGKSQDHRCGHADSAVDKDDSGQRDVEHQLHRQRPPDAVERFCHPRRKVYPERGVAQQRAPVGKAHQFRKPPGDQQQYRQLQPGCRIDSEKSAAPVTRQRA